MKKIIYIITFILVIIFGFTLGGCKTEPKMFSVTYTVTEGGSISGELSQTIIQGGNGEKVTALAHEEYIFVGWSDGNQNKTRQEINVKTNLRICANFEKQNHTNGEQLAAPTRIRIEASTLKWDSVVGASEYIISIDGNKYETHEDEYSLSSLSANNVYLIKVMAKGNDTAYINSEYSEIIKFFCRYLYKFEIRKY